MGNFYKCIHYTNRNFKKCKDCIYLTEFIHCRYLSDTENEDCYEKSSVLSVGKEGKHVYP